MKYYLGIDPGKQGAFVVIDENFGVRITDIISALERASTIQ